MGDDPDRRRNDSAWSFCAKLRCVHRSGQEKGNTPVVTDVGGFCDESSVNLEMGGDHDEYFGRNLTDCRVVSIETFADHC